MSKPQLSPVYSRTHEHKHHSWLVVRIKSKPVQSRLRRLFSRPFHLSHANSSNPAHVVPGFKIRTHRNVFNELGPYGNPYRPFINDTFRSDPAPRLLNQEGTDRGRLHINLSDSLRDQVNKLRR